MIALDTNILIYARDPRYPQKQAQARALMQRITTDNTGVLLWQVACEYMAASRKLTHFGFTTQLAWQNLQDLQLVWTMAIPSKHILGEASYLISHYSLSFWDAIIIAACLEANVRKLYSEDLNMYPQIGGLQLINPFI